MIGEVKAILINFAQIKMKHLFFIFLLLPLISHGQKQGKIWYFGGEINTPALRGTGLDFNSGTPVQVTNSVIPYNEDTAT